MRRYLLGGGVVAALLAGFFLVYFAFSGFRASGQSYATALSDFMFMSGSYLRQMAQSPPPFDEGRLESVMSRFRSKTHWEVRKRALWTLKQWGAAAGPALVREAQGHGDPYRLVGATDGLAAIGHPRAAALIGALLERFVDDPRRFRSDLVDALGDTGDPAALAVLTAAYRRYGNSIGSVLEAIGKCGGTDFLLSELARARSPDDVRELIWPLAYTRDPRAARAIAGLLVHRDGAVRVRAYSAMAQTMGAEAVAPLIDVLNGVGNEYVLSSAINQVLARRVNRASPAVVPYLDGLVGHPTLDWQARYALARVGGPEALAAFLALADSADPDLVMQHLEVLGEASLPILARYLEHPEAGVRHAAMYKADELREPAVRPLLEPLVGDPDRHIRRTARTILFELDNLDLLRSFADALPGVAGHGVWYGFRRDMDWGFREGYRHVLTVFSIVHWSGIVVSGVLGLLLVMGRVRIFETYRFTLFVAFLLAEGLVGNFFFLGAGFGDPQRVFTFATGVHLLLLIGFLFQERERLPRELRGRFERLGGASLWLLAPPLLFLGTPLVAEGLRVVVRDFETFLPYPILATVTVLLVLEQWALPWRFMPRGARFERLIGGVLAAALVTLFARPLQLVYERRISAGDTDGAVLVALLTLPLLWMLVFHVVSVGLLRPGTRTGPLPAPPGLRLQVHADGDRLTVRARRRYRVRRGLIQGVAVFATGGVAAALAGLYGGRAPGMVLAFMAGLVGAALAGLLFEAILPRLLIQVRGGYVRGAVTRFGVALGGSDWMRRPVFTSAMNAILLRHGGGQRPLSPQERDWLTDRIAGDCREAGGRAKQEPEPTTAGKQEVGRRRMPKPTLPAAGATLTRSGTSA